MEEDRYTTTVLYKNSKFYILIEDKENDENNKEITVDEWNSLPTDQKLEYLNKDI